ncbi:WD40/YVTN/BNR-like repeat-containing protein [Planococcus faecalis]|uniref:WD40/YVTN/BNR-like repeat-containing protein n=1 Tax=Planococcus faecalis TaxID=1598147 RepID=UPI0008DAC012|nr:hypothetical protein [Planococcus faecalis]OHX55280.1 hypothetical protein BB777_04370 [Planococcus faecalis]
MNVKVVNEPPVTEKMNLPDPILPLNLPVNTKVQNTNGVLIRHLTKEGVLYGVRDADSRIFKSVDFGGNWIPVLSTANPEFDRRASHIHKFDNGKLLAITDFGGRVHLSDINEENFEMKYEFNTAVASVFGVDIHGDTVLVAGYGGGVNYNKCFMSKDCGETWEIILQHPDPTVSHFHDIRYDPYEGIIWASSGDYGVNDNIFYSNDLGNTWQTTYGLPDLNVRITAIIPLPKCVLFISDTNGSMFVWRYDRLPGGTQGNQVFPYKAWYSKRGIDLDKSDFVGSKPAISYGANSSAFFGWHCYSLGSDVIPANVFATKDGYSFTPIWQSDNLMNAYSVDYVDGGLMGVFGPTNKNELVAFYTEANKDDKTLLPERYAVKLEFPGWGQ